MLLVTECVKDKQFHREINTFAEDSGAEREEGAGGSRRKLSSS